VRTVALLSVASRVRVVRPGQDQLPVRMVAFFSVCACSGYGLGPAASTHAALLSLGD